MSTEHDAPFGAQLRRLREAAGLMQEELASRAGLSAKAVSALERGERRRPYPHTVRALADALGLSENDRVALVEAVPRRGAAVTQSPDAAPAPALPVPPTPLVGRGRDLEAIGGLLLRREARVLTSRGRAASARRVWLWRRRGKPTGSSPTAWPSSPLRR